MVADDYEKYVARFTKAVGPLEVGVYGKWKGHLVKRLSREEFDARNASYSDLCVEFQLCVDNGMTISNKLMRKLREHAAELILTTHGA